MIPCLFSPIYSFKSPSVLQRSLFLATYFDFLQFTPMESFALLKFWKTSTARVAGYGDTPPAADDGKCLVSVVDGGEEEEESFFELEFTLPDCGDKSDCKEEKTGEKIGRIGDFISDEKPDARISSKPQSPMSILKQSAPKLRLFMLGKLIKKSKSEKASQTQSVSAAATSGGASVPEAKTKINFTVKLRIEDANDLKKRFTRSDSSRSTEKRNSNGGEERELDKSSRRFSKDSVNKYINLIKKPLYVKLASTTSSSKRPNDRRDRSDCASTAPFASPRKSEDRANSRFRAPCKNLAKSRSAGALLVGVSSPLKDDSLTQQNDGIQGAILHCKQSFNSSPRERRVMSRCGSDTSHDKSIQRSTDE